MGQEGGPWGRRVGRGAGGWGMGQEIVAAASSDPLSHIELVMLPQKTIQPLKRSISYGL